MNASTDGLAVAAARVAGYIADLWRRTECPDDRMVLDMHAVAHLVMLIGNDEAVATAAPLLSILPDPSLVAGDLLGGLIAARAGLAGDGARRATALTYVEVLDAAAAGDAPATTALLARLALRGPPETQAPAPATPRDDVRDIQSGLKSRPFLDVIAGIEQASLFGRRSVQPSDALPILLDGAALAAFRRYDLPLGLRIMRARSALAPAVDRSDAGPLGFVRRLQGEDGGFGDYCSAVATLAATGCATAEARIRLPVCFQSLWTLHDYVQPEHGVVKRMFGRGLLADDGAGR